MMDIVDIINENCNGHPHAKIKWPHRVLHDARDEITRLRDEVEDLKRDNAMFNEANLGLGAALHTTSSLLDDAEEALFETTGELEVMHFEKDETTYVNSKANAAIFNIKQYKEEREK